MSDARLFRDALARYPTGVAVVAAYDDAGTARAMTINSFASVSLKPPLVLWSVAHDSERRGFFLAAQRYAINVLAHDQQALASACARDDDLAAGGFAFDRAGGEGAPFVAGAIARFDCRRAAVHAAGDHDIIVGEVVHFDLNEDKPALVFHRSAYASL